MTLFVNAPIADQIFDRLVQFPIFLNNLDRAVESLGMPAWALALVMLIALVSLVFAAREFLAWFLKTNAIADEVIRLEAMVRDIQSELKALEDLVEKTKGLAGSEQQPGGTNTNSSDLSAKTSTSEPPAQFPLHH